MINWIIFQILVFVYYYERKQFYILYVLFPHFITEVTSSNQEEEELLFFAS